MILYFKISPLAAGFTETWIHPQYTDLKFKVDNNNAKGVFTVNGSIKLLGIDYDFYKNSVEGETYEIKAYKEGVLFLTSDYNSTYVLKEDTDFLQIDLTLTAQTEYFSDEWQNVDTEYNINDGTPETNDLEYANTVIEIATYSVPFTNTRLTDSTYVESELELPNWDIDTVAISNSTDTGPFWEYDGTTHYKRQEALGYYIDSVKYEPNDSAGWVYIAGGDETINGVTYPKYYILAGIGDYTFVPGAEPWTDITNDTAIFYDANETTYAGVTRKVTDVIEFLFTQMGLTSIAFDSGGTATDSFYSFKTMTGESLTYGSDTTTLLYSHLLIMNLTDFIPTGVNDQKDRPASITNVSLQTLLIYFESLGFEWFLQDRAGTFYFILQYREDKSLGSTNPDLTDYYNKNRTYLEDNIEVEQPEYHKIINETTCNSLDFCQKEIIFTSLFGTTGRKTITDGQIFVDLDDIWNRREDPYSDSNDNNIVIITGQQDGVTKDYVRQATGVITGIGRANSELSFTYLGKNIYCEYPAAAFDIASDSYTADAYRLKKRNKINLNIPYDNIKTDFVVADYVSFAGNNAEIIDMDQASINNTGTLNLKY